VAIFKSRVCPKFLVDKKLKEDKFFKKKEGRMEKKKLVAEEGMAKLVIILAATLAVTVFAFFLTFRSLNQERAENDRLRESLVKTKKTMATIKAELASAKAKLKAEAEAKEVKERESKNKAAEEEKAKAVQEAKEKEEWLNLATARGKQGVEHIFTEQLIVGAKKFGLSDGYRKTIKWAKRKAGEIAIRAGYIDLRTRKEIRIRGKGGDVAFWLVIKDGRVLGVEEYKKINGKFQLVVTRPLAPDFKRVKFIGQVHGGLSEFEYIYSPP